MTRWAIVFLIAVSIGSVISFPALAAMTQDGLSFVMVAGVIVAGLLVAWALALRKE